MSDTILKFLKEINLNNYEFWLSLCKIARSSVICYYPYLLIMYLLYYKNWKRSVVSLKVENPLFQCNFIYRF